MNGSIPIGWMKDESTQLMKRAELQVSALTRHICILGATGSGKSTTGIAIVRGLGAKCISTVILDRTGEYAGILAKQDGVSVFRPGENLAMALFQREEDIPNGVQVEGWIGLLNHFMTVTFGSQISPLQSRVLREVLGQYYNGSHDTLTISRLVSKLESYQERFRQRNGWEESVEALISRLVPLTVDLVGRTFDTSYTTLRLDALLNGTISIFDMSSMGEDAGKNLLSQMVLKLLYQEMKDLGMSGEVRLALVIDEAQHLAPNSDYFSIPERCAIELRKYGFSLITIATRPSLISQNILSNSSTLISHVLVNEHDIEAVMAYFLCGSENPAMKSIMRTLAVGQAVIQKNYPVPSRPAVCRINGTDNDRIGQEILNEIPSALGSAKFS